MPQKPLIKGKKIQKKSVPSRHGKTPQQRKGKFDIAPKKKALLEDYATDKEMTKVVNNKNEVLAATAAQKGGGRLQTVKAPPPVLAPADQKQKAKQQAAQQ